MSAVDRYTHRLRVLAFLFRFKLIHGTFLNFLFRNSLVHILAPKLMTMWHACVCVWVCVSMSIYVIHTCVWILFICWLYKKQKHNASLGWLFRTINNNESFFILCFFLGELAKRLWLCNIPTKHPTGFRCRYQFRFRCRFRIATIGDTTRLHGKLN